MCVTEYSDLFLNLMIKYANTSYVLGANSGNYVVKGNYLAWREKFWHSINPAWWKKFVMTHELLVYPAHGQKFR
jgi:hypothetical protein